MVMTLVTTQFESSIKEKEEGDDSNESAKPGESSGDDRSDKAAGQIGTRIAAKMMAASLV